MELKKLAETLENGTKNEDGNSTAFENYVNDYDKRLLEIVNKKDD